MKQTLLCLLTAAVMAAALGGGAQRADAAIRLTISDGSTSQVFWSASSNTGAFAGNFGDFEFVVQGAVSDFPGTADGATLQQSILLTDNSPISGGTLPTFTFTADVVDGIGSSTLLRFTQPSGSPLLVSSDLSATETRSGGALTGSVRANSIFNGATVLSPIQAINGTVEGDTSISVVSPPGGFTLSSQVILSGANVGISGLVISATNSVTGSPEAAPEVPEPASLAVFGLGGLGLVLATRRRLVRTTKPAA